MENTKPLSFFLGANSKSGFYSLYDGLVDPGKGDFLWVIKGGPGCGKSSFMRKIGAAAEARGLPVEYVVCSGDPGSLDAVKLPTLRTAYVDGTAPHVMECDYPGAASLYLDLGRFYDSDRLKAALGDVMALNRRYKALYGEAYGALAAAAALLPRACAGAVTAEDAEKAELKARRLAKRELRPLKKQGAVTRRFISAVSCEGRIFLEDTLAALCGRVFVLDNELGLAEPYLRAMAEEAVARGYDVTLCPDPLEPELLCALLIPEAGLGFVAQDREPPLSAEACRHVRLDAIPDPERLRALRPLLRRRRRESKEMLAEAVDTLARAKALHDQLEAIYNPLVDFDGVYAAAEEHIARLFG